jgi:Uma2 family endonuclease
MTSVKPTLTPASESLPVPSAQSLPTMYDLPSEHPEDTGLPDEFHRLQAELLSQTFQPTTYPADRVFVASDMNIYYDPQHTGYYKRPDWFGVVDVPNKVGGGGWSSFVRWEHPQPPVIIVELLSLSTLEADQGLVERGGTPPSKWEVYESILRVPYYVLFDKLTSTFRIFELRGMAFQELFQDRLWIETLGIGLGVWQGTYSRDERLWLRWYDSEGNWISTAEEREQIERQRATQAEQQIEQERRRTTQAEQQAEQERQGRLAEQEARIQAEQQAEQERQRANRLAERLKAMGLDPDNL